MGMTVFDIITIVGGVALLVAPEWVYQFGRREKVDMPANWPRISRILGLVFIAIGLLFIYLNTRG